MSTAVTALSSASVGLAGSARATRMTVRMLPSAGVLGMSTMWVLLRCGGTRPLGGVLLLRGRRDCREIEVVLRWPHHVRRRIPPGLDLGDDALTDERVVGGHVELVPGAGVLHADVLDRHGETSSQAVAVTVYSNRADPTTGCRPLISGTSVSG